MKTSPEGIALIQFFEGLSLEPYHDAAGLPTIGRGHLLSREAGADLRQWAPITALQAEGLFSYDLVVAEYAVRDIILPILSSGQFSALVSFVFNVGSGALRRSTLRHSINIGALEDAPRQLRRWVWASGKRLDGLIWRREAEIAMGQPWITL